MAPERWVARVKQAAAAAAAAAARWEHAQAQPGALAPAVAVAVAEQVAQASVSHIREMRRGWMVRQLTALTAEAESRSAPRERRGLVVAAVPGTLPECLIALLERMGHQGLRGRRRP